VHSRVLAILITVRSVDIIRDEVPQKGHYRQLPQTPARSSSHFSSVCLYPSAMTQPDMLSRLLRCLAAGLICGVAAFVLWEAIGIALVWNSPDGQAGMGAAVGALFIGGPVGFLMGYGIESWRTGRQTTPQ
jgi:hypothetical protein